ncbi:YgjP-like metallopeptidase domain-containing protein [Streptomyces bacillaris]|uniref:YgjP-like metallopeptidase domain-containing protein n=1 Tax=Streptomyces bacillaris TaxID=68179 RepID=UPI003D764541
MTYNSRTIPIGTTTITLRTSSRSTLDLDVTAAGDITVRGPHDTTDTQAIELVHRRRSWIYRQLTQHAEAAPANPIKHLSEGTPFAILGHNKPLHLCADQCPDTSPVHATGSTLHLRRTLHADLHKTGRMLAHFYRATVETWLERNARYITHNTTKRPIPVTASTRLRTNWITRHPTRGLTLHWATGQLPTPLLLELLHRTLNLHSVANPHHLDRALKQLWLGSLTHPPTTRTSTCPTCSAHPGQLHADHCTLARCSLTGRQRTRCHATCHTVWTGKHPGQEECEEYGWYCRPTPNGHHEPCNADDPEAMHDYIRLYRTCRWDIATQRMVLPS